MSDTFKHSGTLENGESSSSRTNTLEHELTDFKSGKDVQTDNEDDPKKTANIPPEQQPRSFGFARVKTFDPRYNFYHVFPSETYRCLEERAIDLWRWIEESYTIERNIMAKHHISPTLLSPKNVHRKRYERLRRRIGKRLFSYHRALDQANSIFSYPIPKTNVVKGMRKLSYRRHGEYYRMLSLAAREDLRLIGPKRSGIEAFIKNFPDSWLGIKLFGCLGKKSPDVTDLDIRRYSEKNLSFVVAVVIQMGFAAFFLVPLSLMTYHAVSWIVGVSIIMGLCFLMCLLVHAMTDREEVQMLVVFAYGAIMTGFLSPAK